ncbi:MAG TPA: 30S ribosome-binding factor RbfA [Bacteriovoracaceae bacterium]|nr:30S ribosome-binding factor RbfA [Bacteriovoracaceae bacterium]
MAGRGNKFSKLKYEERVRDEINLALRREFADVRLVNVSVTHVELTQDYSHAKVYWDTFNASTRGDAKEAIESTAGRMRKILASKMDVRHTPELHFIYNSQFEDELKITRLLDSEPSDEET